MGNMQPNLRGLRGINLRDALADKKSEVTTAQELTFDELAAAYIKTHFQGAEHQLQKWIDLFQGVNAWEVDPQVLEDAGAAMIEAGYSPATVNRNFSQIGTLYRWAIRTRRIAPRGFISPTLTLTRYPEECHPVTLSESEVDALLAGALAFKNRKFGVYIRLLIETGARRSEVLERTWTDVDLDEYTILVGKTKTGVKRVLHFSQDTVNLMRRVYSSFNGMLFESPRTPAKPIDFKKSWKQLAASIGRPDLRLHDLRHYRAKQMIAAGVPIATAAQALGHSSLILHRRYGHLETQHTAAAIKRSW